MYAFGAGSPHSVLARVVCIQMRAALTLYLLDEDVGAILGRKGQTLVDIQQVSGFELPLPFFFELDLIRSRSVTQ